MDIWHNSFKVIHVSYIDTYIYIYWLELNRLYGLYMFFVPEPRQKIATCCDVDSLRLLIPFGQAPKVLKSTFVLIRQKS